MIARHWRGWTRLENANAYEALLTKGFAGEDYMVLAFEPEAKALLSGSSGLLATKCAAARCAMWSNCAKPLS